MEPAWMCGAAEAWSCSLHGLWIHGDSLQHWVELFERNGYDCVEATWPGEGTKVADCRAHPTGVGIDAYQMAHPVTNLTRRLDRAPIVVGAGVGAAFAEVVLGEHLASAAIELIPALAPCSVACSGAGAINALRR